MPASEEKRKWFKDARFGMFIHWGLYSILGKGEWIRYEEEIPADEYHALADQFTAKYYRPREWARLAKQAGMRYMVLTAKHHDGFCLFDSKYTDFTAPKTAAGRDLFREYVDACREEGLGVGVYFTVKDWDIPEYFDGPYENPEGFEKCVQHFHNQALELMSNYGKIDILFYDCPDDANFFGHWGKKTASEIWRSKELNAKIRELQPDILINNRSGEPEDYGTPEQAVMAMKANRVRIDETCMTMNDHWGYAAKDTNWKSTEQLLGMLVGCAARGNNLLLNVGPDREGRIPAESVKRLQEIGKWLSVNGEAIYGTECELPNWWDNSAMGMLTTKGDKVYACIKAWPDDGRAVMTRIANEIKSATILSTGQQLDVRREGRRVIITGLPVQMPEAWYTVIKMELDGPVRAQLHHKEYER